MKEKIKALIETTGDQASRLMLNGYEASADVCWHCHQQLQLAAGDPERSAAIIADVAARYGEFLAGAFPSSPEMQITASDLRSLA